MKGILEFNLPEEESQFKAATRAFDWKYVVSKLDTELRNRLKYNSDDYTPEALREISNIRELLHAFCEENNLDITE